MPRDYLPLIDGLTAEKGSFSTGDFARSAGVSHARASVVLRRLVVEGRVRRQGASRRALYTRLDLEHRPFPSSFWSRLAEAMPQVAYVPLQRLGTHFRLRRQAQAVYAVYPPQRFTLVDFSGVREVNLAFADALMHVPVFTQGISVQALYPSDAVKVVLARAAWRRDVEAGMSHEISDGAPREY